MLELDDLIFRARALGQTHPFTPRSYRYLNEVVARERTSQPVPELGIWAGHAITAGYCLRRVEEDDTAHVVETLPEPLPDDLDEAATHLAARIRTEAAHAYLLYPEERVVEALDRMIAGEIDRRLSHWEGTIDDTARDEIAEYLAWWVIKGYALRAAELLIPLS